MNQLVKRRNATEQTLAQFRGGRFDWASQVTCAHLARVHLVNLGHDVPVIPDFTTAIGAKRALKDNGWDNVSDMLDAHLPRIPAARMMLGDLALIEGAGGLDAIFICAGPFKVFGWRDDEPDLVILDITLDQFMGVWQV